MKRLAVTSLVGLLSLPLAALSSPPDWRNNQLLLPEKITVGPADNYQARLDRSEQRLFFTRHQNLVSQLVEQDLASGQTRELLSPDHDAKDPALSPKGDYLAITSYRRNALGSVCLLALDQAQEDLNCLTAEGERAWLPFWVDQQTLGYLRRSTEGRQQELVFHSLDTQDSEIIAQGRLSAPTVSPDGRYLIYQRHEAGQEGIHVHDLHQQQTYGPLLLDLPGISSYSLYRPEDGHLYFSHFLSDTSGDQQIDGEDHSVIFRIPLDKLLQAQQPQLPEQLTSVRHNCNFPALGQQHLYMTCAYEGSLDTYRLPFSGQLPQHWVARQLEEAHATAQHPAERLLLINSQRYREKATSIEALERLLANHLQMDELTAALFYTQQLQARSPTATEAAFYGNLQQLLEIQARYQQQPAGQLTPAYRREVEKAVASLDAQGEKPLFLAWFERLNQQPESARARLDTLSWPERPLASYLQAQLSLEVASSRDDQLTALLKAAQNTQVAPEARIFYGFTYLQTLTRELFKQPEQHLATLQAILPQLEEDPQLSDLFANELDLLALAATEETAEERRLYQAISSRLRTWRDQPQMHRASHIRALQLMGLAEKYDFMELMSRHWLTTTSIRHVNFAATAEQYARVNLNRGYGAWSQGENAAALNTFYSVLRQTSDLEALYNFLTLGLNPQLQERQERLYDQLQAEQLLGNNHLYAEALSPLLTESEPSLAQLQAASDKLQKLAVTGLDTGVKDLLLGYLYHRQLQKTAAGYQRDAQLAQQSHYHYMLALDLAYRNPRIQAALLENLGQLHFEVNNYGLAAQFFEQRLQLPWLDEEQQVWVGWRQARALYYSNRYPRAAEQAGRALQQAEALDLPELPALRERTAFYSLQAQQYAAAAQLYGQLLEDQQLEGNNAIKARFSYAYAQFHLDQATAYEAFQQLLEELPLASRVPARQGRLVSFEPQRLQVQSYGFLAQLSQGQEQIDWLGKRLALLEQLTSRDRRYGWDEQGRYALIIQTRLQKAAAQEQQGQLNAMALSMQASLRDVQGFQRASGPLASQPVLQSLYNYLTLASEHPQAFTEEPSALASLISEALDDLYLDTFMPPVNHYQRLKLQALQLLYLGQDQTTQETKDLVASLNQLQKSSEWQGLALSRPDLYQDLEGLYQGIKQRL